VSCLVSCAFLVGRARALQAAEPRFDESYSGLFIVRTRQGGGQRSGAFGYNRLP